MADRARHPPDGMLIVEWSGTTMLAGGTDRPFGAEAWPVLQQLSRRDPSGPGLVRTDDPGLVSGVAALLEGLAATDPGGSWSVAMEAPATEVLHLVSPRPEEPIDTPSQPTGRGLFAPRTPVPATPGKARKGIPTLPMDTVPVRPEVPSPVLPEPT